jgi:hypothetical protein
MRGVRKRQARCEDSRIASALWSVRESDRKDGIRTNGLPLRAQLGVELAQEFVLVGGPAPLPHTRVEGVEPALAAVLVVSTSAKVQAKGR